MPPVRPPRAPSERYARSDIGTVYHYRPGRPRRQTQPACSPAAQGTRTVQGTDPPAGNPRPAPGPDPLPEEPWGGRIALPACRLRCARMRTRALRFLPAAYSGLLSGGPDRHFLGRTGRGGGACGPAGLLTCPDAPTNMELYCGRIAARTQKELQCCSVQITRATGDRLFFCG